ncbi:MAG: peptidoglycan-binding protein [Clostridia bacterium]|nr:peptidoglycan-binding protein [Clostridia bacterium]
MKKKHIFILLMILLCLIPLFASLAETGTVTASSLNVRAKASSDSNVVGVLREGDKVTIKESSGSWYKVTGNGKTGYVYKKYIRVSSGSSSSGKSSSSQSSSSNGTCAPGDKGDAVRKVQKRLIALGYLSGGADGDYGNATKKAVMAFQKNNGLSQTGKVNSSTLSKLNSSGAKKASAGSSSSSSDGTCGPGDNGEAVRKVQRRLIALGYLNGSADGDYGGMTKKAVAAFQKNNGLSQTGRVNSSTLTKLNSSSAKKASQNAAGTERLDWFHGGSNTIPKGATFKVKDIRTGKVFTCKRWSGYNHLDAEPLTKSDTNTMLSVYGHWSWKRRPVLVKYNGHVYAASMNGMPHGTSTISGNGFDGHFCIHFYGSKTHGSGKVDDAHQNCVSTAMNYSW